MEGASLSDVLSVSLKLSKKLGRDPTEKEVEKKLMKLYALRYMEEVLLLLLCCCCCFFPRPFSFSFFLPSIALSAVLLTCTLLCHDHHSCCYRNLASGREAETGNRKRKWQRKQ